MIAIAQYVYWITFLRAVTDVFWHIFIQDNYSFANCCKICLKVLFFCCKHSYQKTWQIANWLAWFHLYRYTKTKPLTLVTCMILLFLLSFNFRINAFFYKYFKYFHFIRILIKDWEWLPALPEDSTVVGVKDKDKDSTVHKDKDKDNDKSYLHCQKTLQLLGSARLKSCGVAVVVRQTTWLYIFLSYNSKKIFLIWYQSVLPYQERKCLRAMGWRTRESWEGGRGSWWRSKRPPWSSLTSCWCCWLPGLTGWAWKWRERAWNFGNQLESHCNAAQPIDQKPLLSDVTFDSDERTVFSDRKEAFSL